MNQISHGLLHSRISALLITLVWQYNVITSRDQVRLKSPAVHFLAIIKSNSKKRLFPSFHRLTTKMISRRSIAQLVQVNQYLPIECLKGYKSVDWSWWHGSNLSLHTREVNESDKMIRRIDLLVQFDLCLADSPLWLYTPFYRSGFVQVQVCSLVVAAISQCQAGFHTCQFDTRPYWRVIFLGNILI